MSSNEVKEGDRFTIEGIHLLFKNVDRKWWQFWKPRYIMGDLAPFIAVPCQFED